MRYSEEFPLAIKNFNLKLPKNMHIGVCGETGAGKSSILSMLFRFCELEAGKISFYGQNIASMPLFKLRKCMQVVPQFPFLMTGSLAHNLDPFHQYRDDELKYAFEKVFGATRVPDTVDPSDDEVYKRQSQYLSQESQDANRATVAVGGRSSVMLHNAGSNEGLGEAISPSKKSGFVEAIGTDEEFIGEKVAKSKSRLTLDSHIEAGGKNISWGEAQLVAIARMILRKDTVDLILMDEPSSNLDFETDLRIMKVLAEELKDKTVFIIAHRLDTLSTCDRILVMKKGAVSEFGPPEELKKNKDSFYARSLAVMEHAQKDFALKAGEGTIVARD